MGHIPMKLLKPQKMPVRATVGYSFNNKDDRDDVAMRERLTVNPFISVNNQMYATVTGSYE